MTKKHEIIITSKAIIVDGKKLSTDFEGAKMLKDVYINKIGNYPKFYKMDILCQLCFVASELLLCAEGKERFVECDDRAILLFGKNSSLCADQEYQCTISDKHNFYPSPSLFVYTLPNIMTGEIACRNNYHGETSYLIISDRSLIDKYIEVIISNTLNINSAICGWIDALDATNFEATFWIAEK